MSKRGKLLSELNTHAITQLHCLIAVSSWKLSAEMGVWGGTQENNNKNARYGTVFCSVPVVCCDLVPLKLPIKPSLIQKNKAATELRTSEKIQLKDCKGSMSLQSNSEGKRTLFLLSELLLKRNNTLK